MLEWNTFPVQNSSIKVSFTELNQIVEKINNAEHVEEISLSNKERNDIKNQHPFLRMSFATTAGGFSDSFQQKKWFKEYRENQMLIFEF